jgi:hypothetical protein
MIFSIKKLVSTCTISAILLSTQSTFANPYNQPKLQSQLNPAISISAMNCNQLVNTLNQRIAERADWIAEVYKGERQYDQNQYQIYTQRVREVSNMYKRKRCSSDS